MKRNAKAARQNITINAVGELADDDDYPPDLAELCVGIDVTIAASKLIRLVPGHTKSAVALCNIGRALIESHDRKTARAARPRRRGARG